MQEIQYKTSIHITKDHIFCVVNVGVINFHLWKKSSVASHVKCDLKY
jgi:hypothetical protein